jgi:hypothetical protein
MPSSRNRKCWNGLAVLHEFRESFRVAIFLYNGFLDARRATRVAWLRVVCAVQSFVRRLVCDGRRDTHDLQ